MAIDTTEASLYGIGRGGAQVWGQNKALVGLQQQLQQDQLRRQKQEAQLGDELGKINLDAAREADLPELMKKYNGIKDTFYKLSQTKDNLERLKLQSQIQSQKQELMNGSALSKQAQAQESEFGKLPLNHADDITDDFIPNYSKLRKTSIFSPDYKSQAEYLSANALMPKFDNMAYSKKILDSSIENVQGAEQRKKDGRLNYTVRDEGSRLNYDTVLAKTIKAANDDPRFLRNLTRTYQGLSPDQAAQLYAKDIYDQNKDAYNKVKQKNVRQYMDETPDRYYSHKLWDLAHDKTKEDEATLYRQKSITDMINGVKGSGERVKEVLKAKGQYTDAELNKMIGAKGNFIEFRIPTKTITYQNAEGEDVTKTVQPRTVLIDKRDKNSKIKLNELLNDLTGEKVSESKVQTGNSGGKVKGTVFTQQGSSTPKAAPKTSKTVPVSKIKSLVGKAGYEGYTEKELIDYYKKQGYTIK